MKGWRKLLALFLTCLLLAGAAQADMIWSPLGDEYYKEHHEAFVPHDETYITNGKDGYVYFYNAPNGKPTRAYENGTRFWIGMLITMEDGSTWGVFEGKEDSGRYSGYFNMAEMLRLYNGQDFLLDNADKITYSNEPLEKLPALTLMWTYPHSGDNLGFVYLLDGDPKMNLFYTDEEGMLWGFCKENYVTDNFWICLSDPENPDLTVIEAPYEGKIDPQPVPDRLPGQWRMTWLAAALILAVVAVELVLLLRFKKSKGKGEEKHETD